MGHPKTVAIQTRNKEADALREMLAALDPKDAPAPEVLVQRFDRAIAAERNAMAKEVSERVHMSSGRHPNGYDYIDTESVDRFLYADRL